MRFDTAYSSVRRRRRALRAAIMRLDESAPVESETRERGFLDILVRGWRAMKEADSDERLKLMRRYGLSIAELEGYARQYVERVKSAMSVDRPALYRERGEVIEAQKKLRDYKDLGGIDPRCTGLLYRAGKGKRGNE